MQFTIPSIMLALAASSLALPTSENGQISALNTRQTDGSREFSITLCTNAFLDTTGGACVTTKKVVNQCFNLIGGDGQGNDLSIFHDALTSVKPLEQEIQWEAFSDFGCGGQVLPISRGGVNDLSDIDFPGRGRKSWNDEVSSFKAKFT